MNTELSIKKTFSIKEVIKESWNILIKNLSTILPIVFVVLVAYVVLGFIEGYLNDQNTFIAQAIDWVVEILVQSFLIYGLINISFKLVRNENISFSDLIPTLRTYGKIVLCWFLQVVAVSIGFLLLIIPGIFIAIRFFFGLYALVDKNSEATEALQYSYSIVKGCSWKILGFAIVVALINLVGLLLIGIGLLFTIPLTMMATVLAYQQLEKQTFSVSEAQVVKPEAL